MIPQPALPEVAIIELGSQYTLVIERTLCELGVRSVILDPARAEKWLRNNRVKAIVLSGGASSVYDDNAPQPPEGVLSLKHSHEGLTLVLGICYGMQWIAHHLGGEVEPHPDHREYGLAKISLSDNFDIFSDTPKSQRVWMSHGDSVVSVPQGFKVFGHTDSGVIAAMGIGTITGVQFHPEVTQTEYGKTILRNFLKMAGCERDWQPVSIISFIRENTLAALGNRKAVIGFSGGVDSTTLAAILAPALGENLFAITIDGGHLRENELEEIERHALAANVKLCLVDARLEFAEVMAGITDAEEKRKRFKKVYAQIFKKKAMDFGAEVMIQGTLAPDRIESGGTGGALIKSHHNVGLDLGTLSALHPIDHLFKYEIRALAKELGLPESVSGRQPFPGPGLFLRVLHTPATPETLDIVRWADKHARKILERHGIYKELSQLVVAYAGGQTVGIKGDARVYTGTAWVRAVKTIDFMTAEGVAFPEKIVKEITSVLSRHPQIGRVLFDATDKPPATTEFE